MIAVLILVCAGALARPDCQPDTALDVMNGPVVANALLCGLHGQAFLAESAIGRNLGADEYVKIICRRSSLSGNVG